ncbi:MAG: hypothetical protein JSS05_11065 [Proteobacteria bacterium]|nr:hypothetical protein [Pseudomonadota bacterium]
MNQPHESDVKPSPTARRRGLDRAWVYSHYRSQGFEEVFNATFRRWRAATGRGAIFWFTRMSHGLHRPFAKLPCEDGMNDQRNPSSRKRRSTPMAVGVLALLCIIAFVLWAQRGLAFCDPPRVSPGGSYEIVKCEPLYSSYTWSRGTLPRFMKFRDCVRKIDLGSSGIVNLAGNGRIWWPTAEFLEIRVGVGDSAVRVPVTAPDGR